MILQACKRALGSFWIQLVSTSTLIMWKLIHFCSTQPYRTEVEHASVVAQMVIAYLMKSRGITFEDAFKALKEHYPVASPNSGFVDQLKMFGSMSYRLDESHPEYKRFRLKAMSDHVLSGGEVQEGQLKSVPREDDAQDNGVRIY